MYPGVQDIGWGGSGSNATVFCVLASNLRGMLAVQTPKLMKIRSLGMVQKLGGCT